MASPRARASKEEIRARFSRSRTRAELHSSKRRDSNTERPNITFSGRSERLTPANDGRPDIIRINSVVPRPSKKRHCAANTLSNPCGDNE